MIVGRSPRTGDATRDRVRGDSLHGAAEADGRPGGDVRDQARGRPAGLVAPAVPVDAGPGAACPDRAVPTLRRTPGPRQRSSTSCGRWASPSPRSTRPRPSPSGTRRAGLTLARAVATRSYEVRVEGELGDKLLRYLRWSSCVVADQKSARLEATPSELQRFLSACSHHGVGIECVHRLHASPSAGPGTGSQRSAETELATATYCVDPAVDPELAEDPLEVGLHGVRRHVELRARSPRWSTSGRAARGPGSPARSGSRRGPRSPASPPVRAAAAGPARAGASRPAPGADVPARRPARRTAATSRPPAGRAGSSPRPRRPGAPGRPGTGPGPGPARRGRSWPPAARSGPAGPMGRGPSAARRRPASRGLRGRRRSPAARTSPGRPPPRRPWPAAG